MKFDPIPVHPTQGLYPNLKGGGEISPYVKAKVIGPFGTAAPLTISTLHALINEYWVPLTIHTFATSYFFGVFSFFSSLLLPKSPSDLLFHCSCPLERLEFQKHANSF